MKPEVVFGLEEAAWPALLVNAERRGADVQRGGENGFWRAAGRQSGRSGRHLVAGERPRRKRIFWRGGNSRRPPLVELKFRAAGGAETKILRGRLPAGERRRTNGLCCNCCRCRQFPQPAVPPESPTEFRTASTGDAALKQKLDCVLQLARTVSLDFNNALTGVLAHTSLLLGKAEPEHPWRRSLLEVEKSAARAAEIASELAQFSRQEKETRRAPAGNLNAVVSRCVDFFRTRQRAAAGSWKLTPEQPLVRGAL